MRLQPSLEDCLPQHFTSSGRPYKWAFENPNVLGVSQKGISQGSLPLGFLGPEFCDTNAYVYTKCTVAVCALKVAVLQHQRTTDVGIFLLLYTTQ